MLRANSVETLRGLCLVCFFIGVCSFSTVASGQETAEASTDGETPNVEDSAAETAPETAEISEAAPTEIPETEPVESDGDEIVDSDEIEPAPRTSGPPHCHGQHRQAWTLEEIIATRTNNFGFANGLRASHCWPLFVDRDTDGIMFALSNIEVGIINWLAPVFVHLGGFVNFTPISLLTIGVEATGYYWWPLNLTRTGHIPMSDYNDRFSSNGIIQLMTQEDRDTHEIEDAFGLNVVITTTLRGRIRVADITRGTVYFIIANTLNFEYWRQGDDAYYWNLRSDAIFAQSDWALTNRAVGLFSFPLSERHALRVGVYDQLLYNLGDTDLQKHQIGGLIGINVSRLGSRERIHGFETVLVVTGMTHVPRTMRGWPPVNFLLKISIPLVWPVD